MNWKLFTYTSFPESSTTIVIQRVSAALGVFLMTVALAACVGSVKPVPTQESQDAPPTKTAEALKPAEPVPAAPPPSEPDAPVLPLPPVSKSQPDTTSTQEEIPVVEAKPVMVTGQRQSYTADRAMSATKTDTPLQETPVSVQVVPRQVIDDQKTSRLAEVLENISGVRMNQTLGGGDHFIIRGFGTVGSVFRNGLLSTSPFGFPGEFDTGNIERIEVVKGPAAVLYGRIQPGGLINVVTKRPIPQLMGALEQQFGSYEFYRTLWDVNAPITSDQTLSVRFAGAYQNAGSFRDFHFTDRKQFSPSITWRPTESTTITVDVEVLKQDYRPDNGIPVIGTRPAPVPLSRSYNDPNAPPAFANKTHAGLQIDHRFNEAWRLTSRFLASFLDSEEIFLTAAPMFGQAVRADGRTLDRNIFGQTSYTQSYATNLDLLGKFSLAGTRHNVLLGFDFHRSTTDYAIFGNLNSPDPALAIDLFNPTYGVNPSLFQAARSISAVPGFDFAVFQSQWYGLYVQDHVTLWDKLHLLAGGRYDWAEVGISSGGNFEEATTGATANKRTNRRFSPRIGLLYQLTPWLAVYGNYVTSLGTSNGISATGQVADPEIGKQREIGLKADLFDHRLNATLAFYHLTKNNVLTPDLTTPDPFDSIPVGEQRSRGIEVDVVGRVTEAVSVIGSYAYTDTRVTKDNSGLQDNRMPNVPLQSGSLWVKYDFRELVGPLKGFSVGFGPYIAGSRHGDIQNTFTLPGYVRLDGFAAYRWTMGPMRAIAQLTVRNLLNQEYYENTDPLLNGAPRNSVYPGAPLTFYGSLRLEY
jgi:iron complex outermembrane receptor protein